MSKKLYTCSVETSIMVIAESNGEARQIASRSLKDEVRNHETDDFTTVGASYPADGWEDDSLPYGENEGLNVEEWIKRMKAEKNAV